MTRTSYLRSCVVGLSLLVGSQAYAIDCDQIMGMINAQVETRVVVQAMEASGATYKDEDIQCLAEKGAPDDVMDMARKLRPAEDAADPITKPDVEDPKDDVLGGDNKFDALGGGEEGDSGLKDEGESDGADPRVIQELIQLYRAKKPLTASKGIYDLLAKDEFPAQRSKLFYYMAKSLDDLEMYHSAQHYYMQVVRKGPRDPYFKYALPKLVAIAQYTGNDTELMRIVHKIPPEAFPRQAKNHLFYLMGRRMYDKDQLKKSSKYFQQISSKSNLFMRSKYYEGVISQQRNKYRTAVKAFRDVYQADNQPSDAHEAEQYANLRDLSLINMGRIYYELSKYDNSLTYYKQVDRESNYWSQSLFERAWANFMLTDLNNTLGDLLTLKSPYYQSLDYNPEAEILRALTFYYLCEYDDANAHLLKFEAKYGPMQKELKAFLAEYNNAEGKKLADQAYDEYFTKTHDESDLSRQLLYRALQNRDLNAVVDHMDLMNDELDSIDEQKSVWRDTVGAHLKQVIEKDRSRYKRKAGKALIQELARQKKKLGSWMSQSQIIRFEIVDAERKVMEKRARDIIVSDADAADTDFAVSRDIIYWPFNGEFWDDELGYYTYAEHGSCGE